MGLGALWHAAHSLTPIFVCRAESTPCGSAGGGSMADENEVRRQRNKCSSNETDIRSEPDVTRTQTLPENALFSRLCLTSQCKRNRQARRFGQRSLQSSGFHSRALEPGCSIRREVSIISGQFQNPVILDLRRSKQRQPVPTHRSIHSTRLSPFHSSFVENWASLSL